MGSEQKVQTEVHQEGSDYNWGSVYCKDLFQLVMRFLIYVSDMYEILGLSTWILRRLENQYRARRVPSIEVSL
mgnify:CR=1 FL=1